MSNLLMYAALAAFAAGAVAGIFLAVRHFLRKRLPVWVALLHGVGGATGFTLVLLVVVREPAFEAARQALYLFIATIALGSVNLLFHIRRKRHRTSLILLHALTAVSGVGTLFYAAMVYEPEPASAAVPAPAAAVRAPEAPEVGDRAATASEAAPTTSAPARAEAGTGEPAPPVPPRGELPIDASVRDVLKRPIHFETNSSELLPSSRAVVRDIASALEKHPEIALLQVQGHADERGDADANLALTRQRAEVVVAALQKHGVSADRLQSAGYGSRCPADPACRGGDAPVSCHGPEHWERDRRVVLLPLRVGGASFSGEVVCARGAALIPEAAKSFHDASLAP